ncbi:MAG: ABC transporter permease [Clostridiales bacterium]|jgi:peptide/nickel transport system permease protein|nr:ABC transporter permease [Clostridiales bacterium]
MIIFRLFQGIVVIVGVTLIVFFASYLTGDPARLMLGEMATIQQVEQFRELHGLNDPLPLQYWNFISNAARGDFGQSIYYRDSNLVLVLERLPATLKLSGVAMLGALLLSIPLGLLSALKRNTWSDTLISSIGLLGQSAPNFWVGLIMIMFFSVQLGLLPVSGMSTWKSYILPGVTLMFWPLAQNIRMMRSSMIEVLNADYIKTAKAKGLRQIVIILKHALRNAVKPVITLIGMQLGSFLGGAIITETIFSWPGVGRLALQAIMVKDFPLLQTVVAFLAIGFVVINLIVDIAYAVLDPRVR